MRAVTAAVHHGATAQASSVCCALKRNANRRFFAPPVPDSILVSFWRVPTIVCIILQRACCIGFINMFSAFLRASYDGTAHSEADDANGDPFSFDLPLPAGALPSTIRASGLAAHFTEPCTRRRCGSAHARVWSVAAAIAAAWVWVQLGFAWVAEPAVFVFAVGQEARARRFRDRHCARA